MLHKQVLIVVEYVYYFQYRLSVQAMSMIPSSFPECTPMTKMNWLKRANQTLRYGG